MITLDQIHCFRSVYETRSYSESARKLQKGRSTIREHILALEDLAGYKLFQINGKKLEPTPNATRLYPRALHISKQSGDFAWLLSEVDFNLKQLTILYDPLLPKEMIKEIDVGISMSMPLLSVNWLSSEREKAYLKIRNRGAELAIMAGELKVTTVEAAEIKHLSLGYLTLGAFAGKNHTLSEYKELSYNDLETHMQLLIENEGGQGIAAFKVSPLCRYISDMSVLTSLLQDSGWAILPRCSVEPQLNAGDLVELFPVELHHTYLQRLCLYHSLHAKHNPETMRVIEVIKAVSNRYLNRGKA
ncbi:LysR family transcriptional regulator [Thaumasiovibrio sp. DFM-14]|uniref:LysR family transcriptional regulator n=1 Tax=Thaumasiovibrio sp. DFM-14 TaxID=3384792 RepID=UPI00399FDD47